MFFEYFPKGPREMTFIISTYHLIREEHPMRPPAVVYGQRGAALAVSPLRHSAA